MTSSAWTVFAVVACLSLVVATTSSSSSNDDCSSEKSHLRDRYEWVGTNIRFPCAATRKIYESTGRYISKNLIPTRFQVDKNDMITAMPRYKEGVAITLAKTTFKKDQGCTPIFTPFPSWSMQEEGNCDAIQSAVDIFMDTKDRLWVLDSGVTNTLTQPIRRCPPKVVVICMKTHKVLRSIDLSSLVCPASRLQYLVVDQSANGFTYLYISDAANRSILVWDVYRARGWRVVLPKAVLAGCQRRDVLYLALARRPCGTSVLHFTYLSSTRMFSIRTEFLRRGCTRGRIVDDGRKPAKIIVLGSDGGTKIYFRYQGDSQVYQWNTMTCFKKQNFELVYKGNECRLATHVAPGFKNLMFGIESNFQDYIQDKTGCVGPSVSVFPLVRPGNVHQVVNCHSCSTK